MARWRLKAGRWLVVLAAVAAGAVSERAGAQDASLVYEKELDLSLNPTPGGEVRTLQAVEVVPLGGKPLSLPALVPALDPSGERSARVIMGKPAEKGAWRSALTSVSASSTRTAGRRVPSAGRR
jgi:hypothetical protein